MTQTIKVGPDGFGGYRYLIAGRLSAATYYNAASAWFDARRPQTVNGDGLLEPERK